MAVIKNKLHFITHWKINTNLCRYSPIWLTDKHCIDLQSMDFFGISYFALRFITYEYFKTPSIFDVQIMTFLSALPLANFFPSLQYATAWTAPLWAWRSWTRAPSRGSYTITFSPAPTTSCVPSGLKHIECTLQK